MFHKITRTESEALELFFKFTKQVCSANFITAIRSYPLVAIGDVIFRDVEIQQGNPGGLHQMVSIRFGKREPWTEMEPTLVTFSGRGDASLGPWKEDYRVVVDPLNELWFVPMGMEPHELLHLSREGRREYIRRFVMQRHAMEA